MSTTTASRAARRARSLATPVVCALLAPTVARAQAAPAREPGVAVPAGAPAPAEPAAQSEGSPEQPTASDSPPTVQTGVVGRLTDAATGEPLIEAPVVVVGTRRRAVTDVDGNFAIELPPGTYALRSYYDLYRPARVEGVVVRRGRATRADIRLETTRAAADAAPVQEVVVTGRADLNTAATALQARRRHAAVSDVISSEEIQRTPDTAASDSVRRVVGATLVDGQYAFVRGLGGRYVNVLLNGVPLPATDPDVPGVQLDLFPATLLASMTLFKTFTPDMPGDFAGGSLHLATRDFPGRFTLSASVTLGGDTLGTLQGALRYRGSGTDWLGFDDGARALPAAVPPQRVDPGRGLDRDRVEAIGEAFPNRWNLTRATAPPLLGLQLNAGGTAALLGRPLGYLVSLTYSAQLRRTVDAFTAVRADGAGASRRLVRLPTLIQEAGALDVRWGLLATASWRLSGAHELSVVALGNQAATDSASVLAGDSEQEGLPLVARRLRFVARTLGFVQVAGEHRFAPDRGRLRWQLNASYSGRAEPDTRDLVYLQDAIGYRYNDRLGSGERFYGALAQTELGGGFDLTIPAQVATARVGVLARFAQRAFESRRFSFRYVGDTNADRYLPPEDLFDARRVGPSIEAHEITLPTDGYRASQQLYAPYARVDLPMFRDALRVVLGGRLEVFRQVVDSASPFASAGAEAPAGTVRTDRHLLPAASATWNLTPSTAVRLAYGGTVARPQVRELAPFVFQDFVRRRTVQGNPDLHATFVHNVDARIETFPGDGEVLAASAFYKGFVDPIEQVVFDANGNVSYANVAGATNLGGELEARVSLRRLAPALAAFTVGANLTLVHSRVSLAPSQQRTATSAERPLAGQSPYVANVSLGCSPRAARLTAFVYYNVLGRRIEEVGALGLPDVYSEPLHQLDAAVVWEPAPRVQLRLTARNLLHQGVVLEQGGVVVQRAQPATSVALRLTWSY